MVEGNPSHPVSGGGLCSRGVSALQALYHPDRLTGPMRRNGDAFEPISWDEALDFIAERLIAIKGESGPEAVFHYKSGGTLGMVVSEASELFFERFGPVTVKRGDICSGAGEAAQIAELSVEGDVRVDIDESVQIAVYDQRG